MGIEVTARVNGLESWGGGERYIPCRIGELVKRSMTLRKCACDPEMSSELGQFNQHAVCLHPFYCFDHSVIWCIQHRWELNGTCWSTNRSQIVDPSHMKLVCL